MAVPRLETLPNECFNEICIHLSVSDLPHLSACSKSLASFCGNDNEELWNLLLCRRLWTVDPSKTLALDDTSTKVEWKKKYRTMINSEKYHQKYLDDLKRLDLEGWLDRHFVGQLAPHWNGWETRYWTWDSESNSFSAWESDQRVNCFASFPVGRNCVVRRVSEEEQVSITTPSKQALNPVRSPKPYVFTILNTSFAMLWACRDEQQLQLWMDKISVTLHPLKFGGRTYKAPAKYLLQKKKPSW